MKATLWLTTALLATASTACRQKTTTAHESLRTQSPEAAQTKAPPTAPAATALDNDAAAGAAPAAPSAAAAPGANLDSDLPVVVRGTYALDMGGGGGDDATLGLADDSNTNDKEAHTLTVHVAHSVMFDVSDADFVDAPKSLEGVTSHGSLKVIALADNDDHVCGTDGKTKCQTAAIRVYTKPNGGGDGLWNSQLGFGLPIMTGTQIIGSGPAGAVVVAKIDLSAKTKNTIKFADLTSAASFPIPISIDYSNAAAGKYKATLIVEYVLQ